MLPCSTAMSFALIYSVVRSSWGVPFKQIVRVTQRPMNRLSWAAPGRPRVVVYRLEGAGHGWPGGPWYAPALLVGRIPASLDATGIVLEFVHQQATRE